MPIRVGIIENQPALVLGITVLVNAQPDMTFVGAGRSVRELLSAGTTPDVVLVDPAIADSQAQVASVTTLLSRGIGVLIFTDGVHARHPSELPEPGGVETVRKTDPLHRVIAGIRAAHRSRSGRPSVGAETRDPASVPEVSLSPREEEVLELYATGATAAQVAQALGITRNTVVDHIKRIRLKYIAAGRPAFTKVDLFRRAVEDGLAPDESV
ncbi:response regulator transcription factor [Microbacterium aurugineum]|uniref:response regulator transcription factor n=1 Tax=Microbacterium aurugineum TaxID=2851642 RepID=UPI0020BFFCF8|nr:LuxR C-terminal-related transcriptional regulator [Microbacterium aurugineum]MCK8475674.1 LuxR C-terminal-related transcriptional regulator [Microbacterium aurugineum]